MLAGSEKLCKPFAVEAVAAQIGRAPRLKPEVKSRRIASRSTLSSAVTSRSTRQACSSATNAGSGRPKYNIGSPAAR